jgi:hypothetical protein
MMEKYRRQGSTAEIDRVFVVNAVIDCIGYPVLLGSILQNSVSAVNFSDKF